MDAEKALKEGLLSGKLAGRCAEILLQFRESYFASTEKNGVERKEAARLFNRYLLLTLEQIESPHLFQPYHRRLPDYTEFAKSLIRPLIRFKESTLSGEAEIDRIEKQLKEGENVILFANHQTEPDPQIIQLLLEERRAFADEILFVAGDRVISDPMAIPLSLGCNLLCIHSKKYIDSPPEERERKLRHNRRTMAIMADLLSEGGKCIYVAPSGGRDRPNEEGVLEVAPFDPQAIEMFFLMAGRAASPTRFYPLALATYHLLPPPKSVEIELGEERNTSCSPVHISFGKEISINSLSQRGGVDKWKRREAQAGSIWNLVNGLYSELP